MADQKITELPIKTSSGIAATDYLLGIDSAEGYQMLIQDLGNYIINNVQATLGGSSQTLAAAIGANTTGRLGFIQDSADLNDYKTDAHCGVYWLNCTIANITNKPTDTAQGLLFIAKQSDKYIRQFYVSVTAVNTSYGMFRYYNSTSNIWTEWSDATWWTRTISQSHQFAYNRMTAVVEGDDLNTFKTPGNWYCANNQIAATLLHCPTTASGFSMHVEQFSGGTGAFIFQTLYARTDNRVVQYTRWQNSSGSTWTPWTSPTDDNTPHFATGSSVATSAGLLATDTDINQILTGEYYWASASYRPSTNIPDTTAVRGRLWALDSGGQDIYCAQICYTSNLNWFIRYCTSKSSYTWTEWKQINGTPKQLSGITSLSDIPIGSNGYAQFDASVSPTGATAYFTYWCTGVNDRRSLIAVYTADSTAKAYVNVLHNSDGVTWKGWKSITLS